MGTKLYVGNLNYNTNEESLRQLFGSNGREVASVSVIMDRETGRSRGFAFVEMATAEFAEQALKELDGADLDGRALRINEARERDARGPRSFGGPPGGGGGGGSYTPRPPGGGYTPRPPGAGFGAPRPPGGGFGAPRPPGGGGDDRKRGAPGGRRDEGRRGGAKRRGDGDDW
ncbi:MAG: RNA-binding protein [Myxococcales bacterium]|nr:RNA-binding protein [Myxococcales bacterium]